MWKVVGTNLFQFHALERSLSPRRSELKTHQLDSFVLQWFYFNKNACRAVIESDWLSHIMNDGTFMFYVEVFQSSSLSSIQSSSSTSMDWKSTRYLRIPATKIFYEFLSSTVGQKSQVNERRKHVHKDQHFLRTHKSRGLSSREQSKSENNSYRQYHQNLYRTEHLLANDLW